MIQAIVFDMDGLMVDTEPISRSAWERLLNLYGQTLDDATYARIIGLRIDSSARLIRDAYGLPLDIETIIQRKNSFYSEALDGGIPVMPGLFELHAAIRERGLPWGVATSSARTHAKHILSSLGLLDACGALAGGNEVTHGKPAPDLYLLAAERLGVAPERCLALEDSEPGCRAAVAAGMRAIAVPNGVTAGADFGVAYGRFVSLNEVVGALDGLLGVRP